MLESDIENQKIDLYLKPDFNLIDLFRMFDVEAKGFVSFGEFRDGLAIFNLFPNTFDAELLFARYDSLKEGVLRYSEF